MITLPPGFDYNSLLSDYWKCCIPFVGVILLIVAYRLISKIIGRAL